MQQNKNKLNHIVFAGGDIIQMSNLLLFLHNHNFSVCLKKIDNSRASKPMYKIIAPASEHEDVLNKGLQYCFAHHLDNLLCSYPNLDFDTVKNIKARESGLSK